MLDIETVFKSRYPGFYSKHRWLSSSIIYLVRKLCKEDEFKKFAATHADSDGVDLIEDAFNYLNFSAIISDSDLQKIPKKGKLLIIMNHATALDGLGFIKNLNTIRQDIKVITTELLLTTGKLQDLTISVSMTTEGISKSAFIQIKKHLENDGALIIFPSGKPSRIYHGKIQDDRWNPGFFKIALKYNCPILPVYVDGKYSFSFYLISKMLFNIATHLPIKEIHKLHNKSETFYVGSLVNPVEIDKNYNNTEQKVQAIREKLYALSPGTDKNRL